MALSQFSLIEGSWYHWYKALGAGDNPWTEDITMDDDYEIISVIIQCANAAGNDMRYGIYTVNASAGVDWMVYRWRNGAAGYWSSYEKLKGAILRNNTSYRFTAICPSELWIQLLLRKITPASEPIPRQVCDFWEWFKGECVHGDT